MIKIRLAIGLAVITAMVTVMMGVLHQARFVVLLYRMLVSVIIFGGVGYVLGFIYEKNWFGVTGEAANDRERANRLDVQSAADGIVGQEGPQQENEATAKEKQDFAPFSSDHFKQVSAPDE